MNYIIRLILLPLLAGIAFVPRVFAVDSDVLSGRWVSADSSTQRISLEISGDKVKVLELNGKIVQGAELNTCYPPNGHGPFVSISWVEKATGIISECYLHCALGANGKSETRLRGFLAVCKGEDQTTKCKDYEVELKRGN